jgi:hypothetical protein
MNAVSRRFSETTDVNIIFTCFLVTPSRKTYYSAVTRPNEFAASMEMMWKKGLVTLSKPFHYDVAQMISLFQDYYYYMRPLSYTAVQFSSQLTETVQGP